MKKRGKQTETEWENDEREEIIWVSKSEVKRDAEELKKLGEKLTELTKTSLEKIPLDESLLDAVQLAQRLQKEARRRQLQFIGKLLRNIDVKPIRAALAKIENKHQQQQAMLHKIERLRDELIEKGDESLAILVDKYPQADRRHLRRLVRSAQKEKEQNKTLKAYREIFQYLKVLTEEDDLDETQYSGQDLK